MKKISITFLTISFTCVLILSGCSKPDPMNMPMKASTLKEYGESMIKISKAIKDPDDKQAFLDALELVAIGPKAMLERNLPDRGGYEYEKKMEELAKKFDGKTPSEIIMIAQKWKENPSQDPKAFLEEMFEPEKKQARESDAAWRNKNGQILNGLNKIKLLRGNWMERNKSGNNTNPTKEDIIQEFGEQSWPQSDFPPGAEYIITPDGEPACILDGETITMENRSLYEKGAVQ
jgi:hypothetical protein